MSELNLFDFNENSIFLAWTHWREFLKWKAAREKEDDKEDDKVKLFVYPEEREVDRMEGKKFESGRILMSQGIAEAIAENWDFTIFTRESLFRHLKGDWGNLCDEDKEENERALREGGRLFSAFEEKGKPKIWIVTESDRSCTVILKPEEY